MIPVCSIEANATAVAPVSDISPGVIVTPNPAVVSSGMHSVCVEESQKVVQCTPEFGD